MGLMSAALGGAGKAMMDVGAQGESYLSRSQLQDEAGKIMEQRDATLAEFQRQRDTQQQTFTAGQNELARAVTTGEGEKTRAQQATLEGNRLSVERERLAEQRRAEENRTGLTQMQLDISAGTATESARHNKASEVIQRAQAGEWRQHVTLLPQADGTFARVKADGTILGQAIDPTTNKPLQGTKDVAASTKILMEGNTKRMGYLENDYHTEINPVVKQAIRTQIDALQNYNEVLAGKAEPAEKPPVPNAKKGTDGKWYAPDPARPGKFSLVEVRGGAPAAPATTTTQPGAPVQVPGIVHQTFGGGAESPIGRAADAVTGATTNAIESVAGAPSRAADIRLANEALRAKINAREPLTAQDRQIARGNGWKVPY